MPRRYQQHPDLNWHRHHGTLTGWHRNVAQMASMRVQGWRPRDVAIYFGLRSPQTVGAMLRAYGVRTLPSGRVFVSMGSMGLLGLDLACMAHLGAVRYRHGIVYGWLGKLKIEG
jgi:hypothetical protein